MENLNIDQISRIAKLAIKKREGTLSLPEVSELNDWRSNTEENRRLYEKLFNDRQLADDLLKMEQVDVEYHVKNIRKKIAAPAGKHFRIYKMIAAASVIAFIAIGFYILNHNSQFSKEAGQTTKVNDVLPGKNGAILTLNDGRRIVLDSIKNDELIAVQGNVKIIKKNGAVIYVNKNTGEPAVVYNTISTPKGRTFQISLEDGTQVWLNAGSSISYPTVFSGKERRVRLSGEAYFDVAQVDLSKEKYQSGKLAKQPFIIQGLQDDNWRIEVLGTQFNVNAYVDEEYNIKTTLLEGSVQFASKLNKVVLKPGQQVQMRNGEKINVVDNVDIEEVIAWKNGKFNFHHVSLKVIMSAIARWYNVNVIYETKVEDFYTINVYRDMPLRELLSFIEKSGGVHFTINKNDIVVTR